MQSQLEKEKRDSNENWRCKNWVELVETSVQDIVQTQFPIKSGTKLDKKDALFVEFS